MVALLDAAIEPENNSAIRFHFIAEPEEAVDRFYVTFDARSGDGQYGRVAAGPQTGGEAYSTAKSVKHELAHVIGLAHTQQRFDRDDNVAVHNNFMQQGAYTHYRKISGLTLVGPYDTESIVHYDSEDFSSDTCAAMSFGVSDPTECITNSPRYRATPANSYSEWNFSVFSALYSEPRFCEDRCADAQRYEEPQVLEHLARLSDWEILRGACPRRALATAPRPKLGDRGTPGHSPRPILVKAEPTVP
ncbi:MAG: hypothetical protein GY811_02115 [Myxococcales bacterium]|nr:hypothetical protein [Myxococcales bacterium]